MRILIVDSSAGITERLEEMFIESANITAVYKTISFNEAAALFKQNIPAVVLLDIYLPGNDSINLLKEIKRSGFNTIIIILSGQQDNYMQEQYSALGADFFLDKYHDFDKLPGLINSIFYNTIL